jgi:hypothetical protein
LLHTWKAYAALVRSLELSLDPDQEVLSDLNWDEFPLRDITEKLVLMFISQLVNRYDANKLVKARFVEKWLVKQNWGTDEHEREVNFVNYATHRNNRLSDIIGAIRETRAGREALANAKLCTSNSILQNIPHDHRHLLADQFRLLLSINLGESHGDREEAAVVVARTLQSPEAGNLRQRNREAMVLNDGSHPVNRDDIIQRERGVD